MNAKNFDASFSEIHDVLLELFFQFDDICKKHNLTYFLAYGSLLGGVRHNGFIPWDDDFDVWMARDQYDRLIEVLNTDNLQNKFGLFSDEKKWDLPLMFQGKFVNREMLCDRNKFGTTIVTFPWIDIFILDTYPIKKEKKYLKSVKRASVFFNLYRLKDCDPVKRTSKGFHRLIFKANDIFHFLDRIKKEKVYNKFLGKLTKYKSGDMFFCFATEYMSDLKKCSYRKEWFDPVHIGKFEKLNAPFPQKYDLILNRIYNDYMVLPPVEKRNHTHEINNIRTDTSSQL